MGGRMGGKGETTRDRIKLCMCVQVGILPAPRGNLPAFILWSPRALVPTHPYRRDLTKPRNQASCLFALRPGCPNPPKALLSCAVLDSVGSEHLFPRQDMN